MPRWPLILGSSALVWAIAAACSEFSGGPAPFDAADVADAADAGCTEDPQCTAAASEPCHVGRCMAGACQSLAASAGTLCPGGVCSADGTCGECVTGKRECVNERIARSCQGSKWTVEPECAVPATACENGECIAPSCAGQLPTCGASKAENCCKSVKISGYDKFAMGRSLDGGDAFGAGSAQELPEHAAFVSSFYLDKFEVTVGRFRKFLDQYKQVPPGSGEGAHPTLAGSGWKGEWNAQLDGKVALANSLACDARATWTTQPAGNELRPVTCASWYEAFAFCIWDGGRLPTETEWELAAAGGLDNRRYPWGANAPTDAEAHLCDAGPSCLPEVGSRPAGDSRNGLSDLAGGVWERALDIYEVGYYATAACASDCANLNPAANLGRAIRGGAYNAQPADLRAVRRDSVRPDHRDGTVGFRCAR